MNDQYCRPDPIRPPTPSAKIGSQRPNAPPSGSTTVPVAGARPGSRRSRAGLGGASHPRTTPARKPSPRGGLVDRAVAGVAVVADRRPRHEHAGRHRVDGDRCGEGGGAVDAAVEDLPLVGVVPALVADAGAGEVDHGVDAVEDGAELDVDRAPGGVPAHLVSGPAPGARGAPPRGRRRAGAGRGTNRSDRTSRR